MKTFTISQAAQDLKDLRVQFAEEARREYKAKMEKQYRELINKGKYCIHFE